MKLSECKVGKKVTLTSVTNSTDDFLTYLNHRQLNLNTEIKITNIEKFDASMTVEFNGKTEILSKMVCDRLLVEKK